MRIHHALMTERERHRASDAVGHVVLGVLRGLDIQTTARPILRAERLLVALEQQSGLHCIACSDKKGHFA